MFEEQPPYIYIAWPAWRYGPDGEAALFEEHDVIPEGWTETPQPEKSHEEVWEGDEGLEADADASGQEEGRQEEVLKRRGRPPKVHEGQF
jgi:hypothetical protein